MIFQWQSNVRRETKRQIILTIRIDFPWINLPAIIISRHPRAYIMFSEFWCSLFVKIKWCLPCNVLLIWIKNKTFRIKFRIHILLILFVSFQFSTVARLLLLNWFKKHGITLLHFNLSGCLKFSLLTHKNSCSLSHWRNGKKTCLSGVNNIIKIYGSLYWIYYDFEKT